jgi:hypothetical protein
MRKQNQIKIWSFLLMILMLTSFAAAVQQTETQQMQTSNQLVIDAQDVITESDAGGGYLSSRDLILIIAVGVGILVLVAVL